MQCQTPMKNHASGLGIPILDIGRDSRNSGHCHCSYHMDFGPFTWMEDHKIRKNPVRTRGFHLNQSDKDGLVHCLIFQRLKINRPFGSCSYTLAVHIAKHHRILDAPVLNQGFDHGCRTPKRSSHNVYRSSSLS